MSLERWLTSWGSFIDGVVGILTLGAWCPSLGYKVCLWFAWREANRAKNEQVS